MREMVPHHEQHWFDIYGHVALTGESTRFQNLADQLGDRVFIEVSDTGAGISPELLPNLFTPFTQEERILARSQGGLGLGLAVSKGIIELHGGTIAAESEGIGCGTTTRITLPLILR